MSLRPDMQLALFDVPELARAPRETRVLPSRAESLPHAARLARQLSERLGVPVHLTLTDNRATLVSFRRQGQALRLRTHHLFLDAPETVVQAIADFVGQEDTDAREQLEQYARKRKALVRRTRQPGALLKTRGRCFDLRAIYQRLNTTYFDGRLQADIGWARRPGQKRRKTILLAGYDSRLGEIRVHPALDQPHVPAFVVEAVVFHAMLHQLFPSEEGGRHPSHPPEFLERERAFPLMDAAQRWQREHLRSLLRS
ncbi:hypothetical protein POL68_29325 [Stigmatella sp. ncwal1]|uniref:Uncharacterized protein n=1 Tax=Stigmatella ashevillensis TaxID=2995309 RepID=A0ABT5DG07_9BACT|nr:hypothetical protein [Stigmatella ashevillena]MDC0712601.1 hypothetical protein [Stigmatella ashevillena]